MAICKNCNGTGEVEPTQAPLNSIDDYCVGETIKYCSCETGKQMSDSNKNAIFNNKPFQN